MAGEGLNQRFDKRNNEVLERLDLDLPTARAEKIDNADVTTSSRATQDSVDAVKTVVDAVQAKTDALPADPASESTVLGAITAAVSAITDYVGAAATAILAAVRDVGQFRASAFGVLEDGAPVALLDGTWVKAYDSGVLAKDTEIWGIRIDITDGSPTDEAFKITNAGGAVKRYPFGASEQIKDNKVHQMFRSLDMEKGEEFEVWVNCTLANGASATVVEIDKVEVD